jgi:hypothetical protein
LGKEIQEAIQVFSDESRTEWADARADASMVDEKTCCGLEEELVGGGIGEIPRNEYVRERGTSTKSGADVSLSRRLCLLV